MLDISTATNGHDPRRFEQLNAPGYLTQFCLVDILQGVGNSFQPLGKKGHHKPGLLGNVPNEGLSPIMTGNQHERLGETAPQ
ncbi:hypothetical protein BV898_19064 [Hypsibius exemplaris]|uniref:Uncharacterized protein n=1 Tax=Hypsibius exemplaris TaxID=2072580 RepID=A0A9X6RP29_HYPEX|nr:hypothetical protein BV898_19064 [Hypsibius exemplaris]